MNTAVSELTAQLDEQINTLLAHAKSERVQAELAGAPVQIMHFIAMRCECYHLAAEASRKILANEIPIDAEFEAYNCVSNTVLAPKGPCVPKIDTPMPYLMYQRVNSLDGVTYPVGTFIELRASDQSDYYSTVYRSFEQQYPLDNEYCHSNMWRLQTGEMIDGLYYHWEFAGCDGARYYLLALPETTPEQIRTAKASIRRRFDAVSVEVLRIKKIVLFELPARSPKEVANV